MLSGKYDNVAGDVLLSAGFMTFLGGFSKEYRGKSLKAWHSLLTTAGFKCTDPTQRFSLLELIGDSALARTWTADYGLPNEENTMNNAVLCEKSSIAKGILCLDPQGEANRWLKRTHHGAGLVVTK